LNSEAASNPFDILRTKAFLLMRQNGWTRMAITSPNQSCGKSTTACNLAVGLSRQRENRTMLFDMDLRRPNVANLLGCKPEHSMKDMLTSQITPQEQMLCLRGNLAISMTSRPVLDSTQLLLSQHTSDKLDEIVARAEQTKMSQLDQCEREVAQQTNVLGVVLNNCRHSTQEDQGYEAYT